jgi:uncharacterized protein YjbI with pentapeptide repeats
VDSVRWPPGERRCFSLARARAGWGWRATAFLSAGVAWGGIVGSAPSLTAWTTRSEIVVAWEARNLLDAAATPAALIPGYVLQKSTDLHRWSDAGFTSPARVGGLPGPLEFRMPLVHPTTFFRLVELREFAGADLSGASLAGAKLSRVSLRGANLCGARLDHALLVGADLEEADLENASLVGADLALANLHRANLTGANLCQANLAEAGITLINLTRADLTGGMVPPWDINPGVIYRNTTLPDGSQADDPDKWRLMIDVITTGGEGLDLRDADLSDLDLSGVELPDAALTRTDLRRSNLGHADLRRADLSQARLDGASLAYAKLSGADLSAASLTDADLTGTDLTDAKLPPRLAAGLAR